jgi:nucleotide-binding universal stress UspA family protein
LTWVKGRVGNESSADRDERTEAEPRLGGQVRIAVRMIFVNGRFQPRCIMASANTSSFIQAAPTGERLMYKHIVLPYDGSELSDKALDEGIGLAKSQNAKITLIYVVTPHHLMVGGGRVIPGLKRLEQEYAQNIRAEAKQILDAACQRVTAAGLTCEVVLEEGLEPYQRIIDAAGRLKCDLVVMASHGQRGLDSLVVGSQTMKILTHSTIPVLVVR